MRRLIGIIAIPFVLSCQDSSTGPQPTTPGSPNAAIIDGAHGGNPHFFWLDPQWTPTGNFPGTATTALFPTVKVCRWSGNACTGPYVVFERSAGTLRARTHDYLAEWNTWESTPQANETFRVWVFLGTLEIGARDLKFVSKAAFGNARNNNPDFAPILYDPNPTGNNRPTGKYTFRFRLEEGVLREALGIDADECPDCAEGSVSQDATETVVIETASDEVAVVFPPNSVPEDINVFIEKLPTPCLPTDLQQYPACYRFIAIPDVNFTGDVVAEVCLEQVDNFALGQVQLHKVDEILVNGEWVPNGAVTPLENVDAQHISCDPPVISTAFDRKYPNLARGVRAMTRPLAKVLGPKLAYADDEGYGGKIGSFSRVGWARGVNMSKVSGDEQSGAVGSTLDPAIVSITPRHGTPPAASVPLSYYLVSPVSGPGGMTTGTTDAAGQLSIPLTLGSAAGNYTLVVTAPGTNISTYAVPIAQFTLTAVVPAGSITGTIVNALNGSALTGATVDLRAGFNNTVGATVASTTTNGGGAYSFTAVPAGPYTVTASASGFVDGSTNVTVTSGVVAEQNIALIPDPTGDEIRIVLTWGQDPEDLDSHLLYTGSDQSFHIAWYDTNSSYSPPRLAGLDIDDTNSFGPETITIKQLLAGNYTYFVHHWYGAESIATSGAQVNVYFGSTHVATFTPPNQPGTFWKVFKIEAGTVVPVGTMSDSEPTAARPFNLSADETFNRLVRDNQGRTKSQSPARGKIK